MKNNNRVSVNPALLVWARKRAEPYVFALEQKFPRLSEWEKGSLQPTLRQLDKFAHTVHAPIGYLFLPAPPDETLPIPDFRTVADRTVPQPSPNLLDMLYACQQRQDWYRDYARMNSLAPVDFIGSVATTDDTVKVAATIRSTLKLSLAERQQLPNWTEAFRQLITKADEAGILVMASSKVGSNNHRKLDVDEFRGFALVDSLAPLVFLNAADSKASQMFTLAHELVHLWLGESGIFDTEAGRFPELDIERWCNAVAAELLMPMSATRETFRRNAPVAEEIQRLARMFKISSLVALRRLFDAGFINEADLWQHYHEEIVRIRSLERGRGSGRNFYRTLGARTGKRFARAVLESTLEGQTLFQDAFRMLDIRQSATFYNAARELEVMA
jgi:Zn-dependent peptidase ImmA (M78 family)